MRRLGSWLALALLGCTRTPPSDAPATPARPTATAEPARAAEDSTAHAATPATGEAGPSPAAQTVDEGEDFRDEVQLLFRVAACGPGDAPARLDAAAIERHCTELKHAYLEYKRDWVDVAEPFLAALRPVGLPSVVVYPFGGGDLTSALATFPDLGEITTISLEPAGDVRGIDHLSNDRLASELHVHRDHIERLFAKAHSRTDNLEKESRTDLPGEIVFDLGALAVRGEEPVGLRYFRLRPDGALHYVTQGDIDAARNHPKALRALFENAELRFRRAGDGGPVQTLRHISFNLDDEHLRADPSLLAYLDRMGDVAAMTKAASHLLWSTHFSLLRAWLIQHVQWMASDSTGLPPRVAKAAGFAQDTYGSFAGPAQFGLFNKKDAVDFKNLFLSQPHRDIAFRYGYPDEGGRAHLIITRRTPNSGPDAGPGVDGSSGPPPAHLAPTVTP